MKVSRRAFLKVSAASGAGAALASQLPRSVVSAPQETSRVGADENWVPSVCLQCPGGCGIKVRIVNGRAVKIEGNPEHPINLGRLCPKGHIGLQILYDPDRIKGPMKRLGKRGEGRWERIGWNQAIEEIAAKLSHIRQTHEPHTLAIMWGRDRGVMGPLLERFLQAFGSPNKIPHGSLCGQASKTAHYLTQGNNVYFGYDLERTNYLLSFGAGLLEAWRPAVRNLRAYGYMRRERPGHRAKIVQVDTRFSVTAAKADEWIPISPGTDAALALGIAHVIVKEELYDAAFVAEHTFGFEDWVDEKTDEKHIGFKTLVLEDYPPGKVSAITGIPAETIVRLAEEFAATRPAIAVAPNRGVLLGYGNGIYTGMAIHVLNALVGSIETRGGLLVQKGAPWAKFPDVMQDDVAREGMKQPRIDEAGSQRFPAAGTVYQNVADAILRGRPYRLNALFLYYTNPAFSSPDGDRFYKAFEKIPLIVDFSPLMSDSGEYADYILPDHIYLERWQDDQGAEGLGYPVVGLRQPVVKPLYETMNTGDVILKLANAIGGPVAEAFPWRSFEDVLKFRATGLFEANRGPINASFEEFWAKFKKAGFWADPPYKFTSPKDDKWNKTIIGKDRKFAPQDGRLDFYSRELKGLLEKKGIGEEELKRLKIAARGDKLFLPHYEPARFVGDQAEYPLILNTYKLMTHAEGRGANSPWLQEIHGLHVGISWDSWLEINPDTAKKLGIKDGDEVWVQSAVGKIRTRAKLHPGVMPFAVNMPFEHGHRTGGRWAKDRGVNPNRIIANEYDYLGGLAAFSATRVKVYKA
jgi:anaerobic selenocysteine-containing dehydrogenase